MEKRHGWARFVHIVLALLFLAYAAALAYLVLLGRTEMEREVILTPLTTIKRFFTYGSNGQIFTNIWGNVFIFLPLGMFYQLFLPRKSVVLSALAVLATSVLIEALQYALSRGVTDIDDVILNTIGGILGILLFRVFRLILGTEKRTKTACLVVLLAMAVAFAAQYSWSWV